MDSYAEEVVVQDIGLTVLAQPEYPEIDIVFVHGLQGHPRKTWTRKEPARQPTGNTAAVGRNEAVELPKSRPFSFPRRRKSDGKESAKVDEIFWPASLLPFDCPTARIMTWGYDSWVSKFGSGPANQSNLSTYAKDLLYGLGRERATCLGRPLIFVAHSLGGIIVKDVLWRSSNKKGQDDLNDIFKSITAVLFLGTPHRGSDCADRAKILSRIVHAAGFDTNDRNIRSLSFHSSDLMVCQENFMSLYEDRDRKFSVRTFQEAMRWTGNALVCSSGKIVEDDSSSLTGGSEDRPQSINENHMNMCRFADRNSDGYRKVVGELKAFSVIKRSVSPLWATEAGQVSSTPFDSLSAGHATGRQSQQLFEDSFSARSPEPTTGGNSHANNQPLSRDQEYNSRVPLGPSNKYLNQPSEFIAKKLKNFYCQSDSSSEYSATQAIQQATVRAQQVTEDFGLSAEFTPRLTLLALYDFVILCDDSSSMTQGNRISALQETVKNIAKWATQLEPSGISIKFLNYSPETNYDHLTSTDDIEQIVRTVSYDGSTRLGQKLQSKVVGPITKKAKNNALIKPVIVAIITDGKPTNEPMESLSNTIFRCKMSPDIRKLGEAVVVFLLCRVGDNASAQNFLKMIGEEERLKGMVCCSYDSIDEELAVFQRVKDNARYFGYLIELFYAALDSEIR